MSGYKNIFIENSKIAFDKKHRKTINFNISRYNEAVQRGKLRYNNLDQAKQNASDIKENAISNLAENLELFEKNAQKMALN